mmetsp:Transcript_2517/g.6005  ORF Transcript_2517/g.6005 Transcript_2517/m.6005 type:complete len:116 (+) Transcript_2517:1995-2342(+)
MVKFAHDCMVKMDQLTIELADKLGEDTRDLKMRVGLHSGSTTAGVLRGEKGRFQLFGDTGRFSPCLCTLRFKARFVVSMYPNCIVLSSSQSILLLEWKPMVSRAEFMYHRPLLMP